MSADLHLITFAAADIAVAAVQDYAMFDYNTGLDRVSFTDSVERYAELSAMIYGAVAEGELWGTRLLADTWLGQVSWAKAEAPDYRRWVPRAVEHVTRYYVRSGGVVQLTPERIAAILPGFNLPHDSHYEQASNVGSEAHPRWSKSRGVARARDVKKFLMAHQGAYSFVDTW